MGLFDREAALLAIVAVAGCQAAPTATPEFWAPVARGAGPVSTGGAQGGAGAGGSPLLASDAGLPRNKVDAVTGATAPNHSTRMTTWNCKDTKEATVPDGNYQVCFEFAESNGGGPYQCVPFKKSATPFVLTPPDAPNIKGR